MAEVIWTIKAVEQVEQIGAFIEKDSPFQARRVVQLIIGQTRELREHARVGRMIPELEKTGIASFASSAIAFSTGFWTRTGSPSLEWFMGSDCSTPDGSKNHRHGGGRGRLGGGLGDRPVRIVAGTTPVVRRAVLTGGRGAAAMTTGSIGRRS